MATMISESVTQAQYNTLPVRYKSWLNFYDELPADVRDEPLLKVREALTLEQYVKLFGQQPRTGTVVEWHIQRDYYLARVAEELLPSRYTRDELRFLEAALYEGGKYTHHALHDPTSFMKRLWSVKRSNSEGDD
jgi:hypothetical protein